MWPTVLCQIWLMFNSLPSSHVAFYTTYSITIIFLCQNSGYLWKKWEHRLSGKVNEKSFWAVSVCHRFVCAFVKTQWRFIHFIVCKFNFKRKMWTNIELWLILWILKWIGKSIWCWNLLRNASKSMVYC